MKQIAIIQTFTNILGSDKTLFSITLVIMFGSALFAILPYTLDISFILASLIFGLSVLLFVLAGIKSVFSLLLLAHSLYTSFNHHQSIQRSMNSDYTLVRLPMQRRPFLVR